MSQVLAAGGRRQETHACQLSRHPPRTLLSWQSRRGLLEPLSRIRASTTGIVRDCPPPQPSCQGRQLTTVSDVGGTIEALLLRPDEIRIAAHVPIVALAAGTGLALVPL